MRAKPNESAAALLKFYFDKGRVLPDPPLWKKPAPSPQQQALVRAGVAQASDAGASSAFPQMFGLQQQGAMPMAPIKLANTPSKHVHHHYAAAPPQNSDPSERPSTRKVLKKSSVVTQRSSNTWTSP